ncbi:uncharacterized protein IL334_005526 [Kwoniella shivajii]|uniref:Helicase C-terminal domain-containing protein n=1 Tax=Kwoniella shivajii TaxID=564305 RepID=A0ABZ1D4X4_9TREE|nr:hypothetical protein IL334_005526 [Kwoniella shivajii]
MPHPDSIQLGTIHLKLSFKFPSSSVPRWSPITTGFLASNTLFDKHSSEVVEILRLALNDVGLGFQVEWIRHADGILIRCWILPSDVPGSMWKSIRSNERERIVKGLLMNVRRSWELGEEQRQALMDYQPEDDASMQDIYTGVPSPHAPQFGPTTSLPDKELFESLEAYENPYGVRTDLYKYQIRSVAKMVRMEMQPEKLVDPLFTPFREAGREGAYYVNLSNWDIQRHPGWYDLPKGGILCEQMGTGKTLMCLSLIVSTLFQPTLPPPITIDLSPITTDIAERTYPFTANHDLRALTGFPRSQTDLVCPSLVELCSNVIATYDPSVKRRPDIPDIFRALLNRRTFYCVLPVDNECSRIAKKRTANQRVKKIYLAKGTLIVLPQILVHQWIAEIEQHLEEGLLKVYQGVGEELPSIEILLDYDVILMDTLRFGAEESQHRSKLGLPSSVLLQARWKRIILDEGHTAQSKSSNSMTFARQLSVERRWLVSGTPTRHLQQGGETEIESLSLPDSQMVTTDTCNFDVPLDSHQMRRPWNQFDLEDAQRIGRMIGGFLAAEPFKTEGGFEKNVLSPLKNREGPSFGAVRRMKYIMDGLMVKHAPKVIDIEAQLPPSIITNEMLRFDPMQKITYNVLAALVASNVYTSGGEDADYFLHKDNRESFLRVVDNLHLACFWYSARDMGTEGCLVRTQDWLRRHPEADSEIRQRLEEACYHLETAIDTPGWDEWMTNAISMPLDGHLFPSLIKAAWSDSFDTQSDMVDVHSFNNIRELNRQGATIQELHISGWDHRNDKLDEFNKTMTKYMEKHAKEQRKLSKTQNATAAKAPKAVIKASPRKRPKETGKKRKDEIDERLEEAERNAALAATFSSSDVNLPRPLPAVIQTRSRSAKVNFVGQTVLAAEKDDKFVIFGDAYELGHLTEMLDLLDITSTFVGSELMTKDRRKALDAFQKPEIRVCLLDLKVGARGLNLVVANRVIFLRPIWSLDVQAQAIKRVHRIGQTRPTKIQILVTEGTFEEDIAKRSTKSRSQDDERLYSKNMIENPRFVYPERDEIHTFTVRFTPTSETLGTAASNIPTPTEQLPVTPQGRRADSEVVFATPESPTPIVLEDSSSSESALGKRGRDSEEKPKKKARVAFA